MKKENNIDVATKMSQLVELNTKHSTYSKQGDSKGENTKQNILAIIQQQANEAKESE